MAINTTFVANTLQPKYSKKLLDKAVQLTKLLEFVQQEELEPGIGATSVTFFRPPSADLTATGAPADLTEGVAPTASRDITFVPVSVPLKQIGQTSTVTDVANTVGLVKYLNAAIDVMSEEYALTVDTRLRNLAVNPATGLTKRYAQGLADFAALAGATPAAGCVVPRDLLDGLTRLKINRAPTFGGDYIYLVAPQNSRDILNNQEWREMVRQGYAQKYFDGEIGKIYNCRVVEMTNPFSEDETEGTYADPSAFSTAGTNTSGPIFSGLILGKQALGAVNMKKLGATLSKPQVIVNDKPDKSDPLNQKIIVGWKAYNAGCVLNPNWGITLRGKSQFTG